jgi:pilus assembly protein Flp/PilA
MQLLQAIRHSAAWVAARVSPKSERGATAVEYGIMIAMIAAVVILAVVFLGKETSGTFSCTAEGISTHTEPC